MPKPVGGGRSVRPASLDDRLAHLLDAPGLVRLVPRLPSGALHQLVRHRGLEASTDLLAAATPEQVASVLDVELWSGARPGAEERFDGERFGEWLEALVDADDTLAARIVAGIDVRLAIAGLSRCIRVFDRAAMALASPVEGGHAEGEPFAGLSSEVGGYVIRARRPDAWDAVVALLVALEAEHRDRFHALMTGCRRLSNSAPETDGLDDLLAARGQLLHDAGLSRQARRSQHGYLTAADARALLAAARAPQRGSGERPSPLHAIAADYLTRHDEGSAAGRHARATDDARPEEHAAAPPEEDVEEDPMKAVAELLAEAGVVPERPRAHLPGTAGEASRVARMQALMGDLHDTDEEAYLERSRELAFLANALVAGCSLQGRPFTAKEASDAAIAVCNLGLEQRGPDDSVANRDLLTAFQAGWRVLHELSMFAAGRLVSILEAIRCADLDTEMGLQVLRHSLTRHRAAGTPWLARDALDVIATLGVTAWAGLLGVLDECPVLPEALTATLEGRTGAVSASAFQFISTTDEVARVHAFMGKLLDILTR